MRFLDDMDAINSRRRSRTVELVRELAGGLLGVRVAALGAAFKPNSDDVRDSPALDVAHRLHREGADVIVYDPEAAANAHRVHPDLPLADSLTEAMRGSHVTVLLTEWDRLPRGAPRGAGHVVAEPRILDARDALDARGYTRAGWAYRTLGRPFAPVPSAAHPTSAAVAVREEELELCTAAAEDAEPVPLPAEP